MKEQQFSILITEDETGMLVGRVPELPGCHTQAKTLPILLTRMKEVIELCIEVQKMKKQRMRVERFIGFQQLAISA
jgi:predicted RNase H-like HicB family nuclease